MQIIDDEVSLRLLAGCTESSERNPGSPAATVGNQPPVVPAIRTLALYVDWNRHPGYFLACVLLLTLGGWGLFAAFAVPDGQAPKRRIAAVAPGIARVVWNDQAVWKGFIPRGRDIPAGQQLVLRSGLAELHYKTGTIVVLQGPAEFTVGNKDDSPSPSLPLPPSHNSGYLSIGKLLARVEGPRAKGFTVEMPGGRVEDLGTEFALDVHRDGAADVVVFSGAVDLVGLPASGSGQRMRLTEDQGARVGATGGTTARRSHVDAGFAAAMRDRLHKEAAMPIVSDLDPGLAVTRFRAGSSRVINTAVRRTEVVNPPASLGGLIAIIAPRGKGPGQTGRWVSLSRQRAGAIVPVGPQPWRPRPRRLAPHRGFGHVDRHVDRHGDRHGGNPPRHRLHAPRRARRSHNSASSVAGRTNPSYGVPHACLIAPSAENTETEGEK